MTVDPLLDIDWANRKDDKAPGWAHALVVTECFRQGIDAPRLRFVKPTQVFSYGGRYFPSMHAIAVIDVGRDDFNRAVLCHELAHSVVRKKYGRPGVHDPRFYEVAREIYMRYGVSLATAKAIEDNAIPDEWKKRKEWW